MTEEKYSNMSPVFNMISKLQRIILYITLFVIPWFVIPLPFDSTEKIRSIVFIFLASLIILFEVVKWVWDGKMSIIKSSLDKVFLVLFLSFLISTVFAKDTWMSFWGFDGRLGTSFFVIIFLFLFFYLSRGFLQKKEEIIKAISALSLGMLLLIILSLLSVNKINVMGWIPYVKHFFVVGLPLTFSFQEIMLISGASIFMNIFLLMHFVKEKKYQAVIYPIIALFVSFLSMSIFSVNQGILIPILFFVVMIPVCILLGLKLKKSLKAIPTLIFVFSVLTLAFSIGFQYESFIKSVLGESFTTINPLRLGADISWIVASSSIVNDFLRGLIGLGNDSFGIAYNLFKPSTEGIIALGNTTFVSGSNEVFTILANRGLIGVTVWIILGLSYLRLLIKQITSVKSEEETLSFLLGLNSIFLFLGSIFLPFSFLTYFLLFVITLLLIVYSNKEVSSEEFLLRFWAVNVGKESKDINKTMEGINWFLTILVTLLTTGGIIFLFVKSMSTAYIVRAEAYNTEKNLEYADFEGEIPFEIREEYLERMAGYYNKALKYDATDSFVNRKASLISLEIIKLLSEKYSNADDTEKETILSSITVWKNTAIDLSREAVTTSRFTYANWNTRANVYIGLISVGLSDYSEDALGILQNCVNINPLDYDSYYKMGQIYMVKEDYEKALAAFNVVLNINRQHVPSLVLSASILSENGDIENATIYLQSAKEILELNELDSGDMYESIVNSLQDLGSDMEVDELEEVSEDILPQADVVTEEE